uniref:Uncharacterized protein n=1 Tax=Oryza sativa subsp. japonica TaxID=39947 RepID=Q8L4S6_ORYSJ|nr:Hypothetical protein [Oryza sativa Japonica Group]AAN04173.1 Hypothetical protein [Oryza sativa Japonica Group]
MAGWWHSVGAGRDGSRGVAGRCTEGYGVGGFDQDGRERDGGSAADGGGDQKGVWQTWTRLGRGWLGASPTLEESIPLAGVAESVG